MGTTTATAARPTFDVPRLSLSEVAAMPSEQLQEMLAESASAQASLAGLISLALAELSRRQAFRADGATSAEAWMVERTGVALASARTWAGVGERLFDLPHLSEALCSGAVPLDKVRVVAAVATPETDAAWAEAAAEHSVRDLKELVRSERPPTRADAHKEYEARSLRFNEALRTLTAQLPAESFAEVRACLEARAKALGSTARRPGISAWPTPSWHWCATAARPRRTARRALATPSSPTSRSRPSSTSPRSSAASSSVAG